MLNVSMHQFAGLDITFNTHGIHGGTHYHTGETPVSWPLHTGISAKSGILRDGVSPFHFFPKDAKTFGRESQILNETHAVLCAMFVQVYFQFFPLPGYMLLDVTSLRPLGDSLVLAGATSTEGRLEKGINGVILEMAQTSLNPQTWKVMKIVDV